MTAPICLNQIVGSERIIEKLVREVACPGMTVLEVGSWAGASSVILGKVCQEYGGLLYCVDWWKGNINVPSMIDQARETDVFQLFIQNIRGAGLEGVVCPMRMSSLKAAAVLKDNCFDLVFIDADHSYSGVMRDIDAYKSKVKEGGILCGHDCEFHLRECDRTVVDAHAEEDWIPYPQPLGMHCGVIKAVGETFPYCELEDRVWYVRY